MHIYYKMIHGPYNIKIIIRVIDTNNCIMLYHEMWLQISTNFMIILWPLEFVKVLYKMP